MTIEMKLTADEYNEKALDAAEDAVIEAGCHHLTDRAIVTAVFDTLERAPWWEEVTDGYEFQPGEPWRRERGESAEENRAGTGFTAGDGPRYGWTYLRDARWTPPPAPLAVGDLIETEEQAESLPVETIAVSPGNTAFRKVGMNTWRQITNLRTVPLADHFMAGDGDRIIYLPNGVSE